MEIAQWVAIAALAVYGVLHTHPIMWRRERRRRR